MGSNLTRANKELFKRGADERFASLADLSRHCRDQRTSSEDRWQPVQNLRVEPRGNGLHLSAGNDGAFLLNDWSFSQLCGLARVSKDTVNRLTPDTAATVFAETLVPASNKPLQLLTYGESLRSVHGVSYTRLWNQELVHILQEFAVDFTPPQAGMNGATGLYAGEQDLFAFMIDPTGWTEIDGEAFAPGFFVWNSEVGKRSLGVSTFWFQKVCQNHIVWDAVEVVEFSRKHTAKVHESLAEVRRAIEKLVAKRDERKDGFARAIRKAMGETLGTDAEEVEKVLAKQGISRQLATKALQLAREQGAFTIFSLVDALTRISQETEFAGDRLSADESAAKLLSLAV
jgi:predicted GNAT family acetyltransferase